MPTSVVKTTRDESLWQKAKSLVHKQYPKVAAGSERYWRLVMGIYNKMKGGAVIKKAVGGGYQRQAHKYVRRIPLTGGGYRYIYPGDEPRGRGPKKSEEETGARQPKAGEPPATPKKFIHKELADLAVAVASASGTRKGRRAAADAEKKLTNAFRVYAEKFDDAMDALKGKGFDSFVSPETKKAADELILKGKTTGYNIDHLGIAKSDYTKLLRAGNCVFYHQYAQNADHGRELLARMTAAGLICPYTVSRMASTVLWDDEWGKDAEVEYEEVGGKKLGRSFQYALVFQPRSAEEADAVANFINQHARAGARQPIAHSWFVPDVRSTFEDKVDGYEQRYLNTRKVGEDEILVLKKKQMKGFDAEPIWLNPELAKFVKAYTMDTLIKGHRRAHTRRLRSGRIVQVRATTTRDKKRRAPEIKIRARLHPGSGFGEYVEAVSGNVTKADLAESDGTLLPALCFWNEDNKRWEVYVGKGSHLYALGNMLASLGVENYEELYGVKGVAFWDTIDQGFLYKREYLHRGEAFIRVGVSDSAQIPANKAAVESAERFGEWLELRKTHVKGHTRRTKRKVTHVRAHERKDQPKQPEPARHGRQEKMFASPGTDPKHSILSDEAIELADSVAAALDKHDPKKKSKYYHVEFLFEKPHLAVISTPAGYVVGLAEATRSKRTPTAEEQVRGARVSFDYGLLWQKEPVVLPTAHAVLAFLDTAGFDLYKLQPRLTSRDMKVLERGSDAHLLRTKPRFPKDKGLRFIFSAEFGKMPSDDDIARKLRSGISDLPDVVKILAALSSKEVEEAAKQNDVYHEFEKYGLNIEVEPSQVTRGKIRPKLLGTMAETIKGIELFNRVIPLAEKAKKFGLKIKYRSVGRGTRGFAALYSPRERAIVVSSTALHALAHELGHFLSDYFDHDVSTIGEGKYEGQHVNAAFAHFKSSLLERARKSGGVPVEEIAAVERKEAKKQNRFARDVWNLYYHHKHGLGYILDPEEVWARFLAQHIAVKLKRKGVSVPEIALVSDYDSRTLYGKARSVDGKRILSRNYMFSNNEYQAAARDFEKWFAGTPVEGLLKALLGAWS